MLEINFVLIINFFFRFGSFEAQFFKQIFYPRIFDVAFSLFYLHKIFRFNYIKFL